MIWNNVDLLSILWYLNQDGIFLKERIRIAFIWEMEVQSSQVNLKTIWEVKIGIKQTEIRVW